jgi:hypothetical protein
LPDQFGGRRLLLRHIDEATIQPDGSPIFLPHNCQTIADPTYLPLGRTDAILLFPLHCPAREELFEPIVATFAVIGMNRFQPLEELLKGFHRPSHQLAQRGGNVTETPGAFPTAGGNAFRTPQGSRRVGQDRTQLCFHLPQLLDGFPSFPVIPSHQQP